jgi:hypothetical protein
MAGRRRKGKRRNSASFRNTWSPDDPPLSIDRLQWGHFIHILYVADYREEICSVHGAVPIPVAARSKAWVSGRSLAGIAGSNPTSGMDVCRKCCVLSGSSLCVGLITRPEQSYRLWRLQ